MHWMNPAGAWALTALIAIIALYILKQKMEPVEVSSTYLWRKALASMEADRPFQKLRKNLLLFLQLLVALLLALSIMRPMTLGGEAGEVVFVFDLSASMQAQSDEGSRIDMAVEDAKRRVDGLPDGARVSVLTAGAQVQQAVTRTADLAAAKAAIDGLHAQNGGADMDGALSLALALQKELEDVSLVVYSDQTLPEGDFTQPVIARGTSNRAIVSLGATDTAAVARVRNYGGDTQVTVECYDGDVLVDVRTAEVAAGETVPVHFDLPQPTGEITARIAEPDALMADNARTWVARDAGVTQVVIAGNSNVFMEKVLALRGDISVLKTTVAEASEVTAGALTVIDGNLPFSLPERGALLLINPDDYVDAMQNMPVTLAAAAGPLAEALNEYVQVDEIQVAAWKPVTQGTPIWMASGQPVLSIWGEDGRRVAVIGFDLHASNLPLLKEFPVFMQQLMAYLAPEPLGAGFDDGDTGTAMTITPQSFARQAYVITPENRRVEIPVTGGTFADTDAIGVYRLVQIDDEGTQTEIPFVLHIPVAESNVLSVPQGQESKQTAGQGSAYGREWTSWLIGLLLAMMLLEWWVYRRGY